MHKNQKSHLCYTQEFGFLWSLLKPEPTLSPHKLNNDFFFIMCDILQYLGQECSPSETPSTVKIDTVPVLTAFLHSVYFFAASEEDLVQQS